MIEQHHDKGVGGATIRSVGVTRRRHVGNCRPATPSMRHGFTDQQACLNQCGEVISDGIEMKMEFVGDFPRLQRCICLSDCVENQFAARREIIFSRVCRVEGVSRTLHCAKLGHYLFL